MLHNHYDGICHDKEENFGQCSMTNKSYGSYHDFYG